jgi:hypothetical protein
LLEVPLTYVMCDGSSWLSISYPSWYISSSWVSIEWINQCTIHYTYLNGGVWLGMDVRTNLWHRLWF